MLPDEGNLGFGTPQGKALAQLKPAPASDPFGAVAWAESVLSQTSPNTKKLLVLLTDAVSTVEGCNVTGRDLTPEFRTKLLADCTHGRTPKLEGVEVWQGGAGLALNEELPDEVALGIEDLWRGYWESTAARLTRYGPTLVGSRSGSGF